MPFFESNGITFHFADDNDDRIPFVFQHGLGADISQPMAFFGEDRPFRLISFPAPDIASWKKIDFPTLVLACRNDLLHPFEHGQVLAREIPGARFAEITAKAISEQKHLEDVRREILQFIGEIDF